MKKGINKRALNRDTIQIILTAACFFAVCVSTQQIQTVAWNTGIIEFARDSLGFLMSLILMTHYKWQDFKNHKIPYVVWLIVSFILCVILVPMIMMNRAEFLKADTIIVAVGIVLMGVCVIHTGISFFLEKYRPKLYLPLFFIWVGMMLLMIFSRSEYLWPECYFVLFLCYYLTEQTPGQRVNVTKGMLDGIIVAYIAIQGHSLLFRPYDRVAYYGNFCNPNHNCMFLCMCLAAILARLLFITKENQNRIIKSFFYLLAASCYSFIFMTACRSGYLSTFVITVFFLIAYCRLTGKKVFFRIGLLLVLLFVAVMPVTYLAVRYIPTIHPHVLFYFQEGYSEQRVHSWDDRNSPKYTTFSQLMENVFGKIEALNRAVENLQGKTLEQEEIYPFEIVSSASYLPSELLLSVQKDDEDEITETDPDKIPVLTDEEAKNNIIVRYTIYKWYFTHLSLRGMPYDEQGFQLTAHHWIQDTHDIYLDYGINFGYPVMILFTLFVWWGIGRLFKKGWLTRDLVKFSWLLIVILPPVFGLFEFSWGTGLISTVAFYFSFKEIFNA